MSRVCLLLRICLHFLIFHSYVSVVIFPLDCNPPPPTPDLSFNHGVITKGLEGKDGNPGNPCLDTLILGNFDENANESY